MWPFGGGEGNIRTGEGSRNAGEDICPVDEKTRRAWLASTSKEKESSNASASSSAYAMLNAKPEAHQTITSDGSKLSKDRVISSIPRWKSGSESYLNSSLSASESASPPESSNWVYPSPNQFFSAMARKNHNPRAEDMNVVVPIHNAVNERAWAEILRWERIGDEASWNTCGGPKLVSFKGRPKDITWKAWGRSFLGYQLPFDRHDWEVDRCGKRIRYVIDFYTGRSDGKGPSGLSFYLDVRPSPAEWEGWRMKLVSLWKQTPSAPLRSRESLAPEK